MICKTLLFSYFGFIFSISAVFGQQIYQSNDYGSPGTVHLYSTHPAGTLGNSLQVSGADTMWDVSTLLASDLVPSQIVARDEAIDAFTFTALCALSGINVLTCFNIWNNTQQAWLVQDSQTLIQLPITDLQRFQRKTTSQLLETFFGFTIDFNGSPTPVVVVYQSPDTVLAFPVMFNDSLSSRISWSVDLSATGQNIQYHAHQTRTSKVDGWGTLITPYDTLTGVLRIRAEIAHHDTLISDTLGIPVMLSQVEYTWYDTSYGIPVMIANGIATDSTEVIASVSYLVESECAEPTWTASTDQSIYYLDDTGEALVDFSVEMSNAGIYTWDFEDGTVETSSGGVTHAFLSPGTYTITVTGCMINCLPLNSCTAQNITIEVIDTTSSVQFLHAGQFGIKVHPIPVSDLMSVVIPGQFETVKYLLTDIHGRLIKSGVAHAGVNEIMMSSTADGVYCLQFNNADTGSYLGVIRLLIIR